MLLKFKRIQHCSTFLDKEQLKKLKVLYNNDLLEYVEGQIIYNHDYNMIDNICEHSEVNDVELEEVNFNNDIKPT